MKKAIVTLSSEGFYCQSRYHGAEKLDREQPAEYERRTWRRKLHTANGSPGEEPDLDDEIVIPQMALKNCLSDAARFLAMKVKGNATYTKHFDAGVICEEPLRTGVLVSDVKTRELFVPSDGKRGGGSRVYRIFPYVPEWTGRTTFSILDQIITESVFEEHLRRAGQFIGLGALRVRNSGIWGRFSVVSVEWEDLEGAAKKRARTKKAA